MSLTINTNLPSLTAQTNLNSATKRVNTAIERMTTGYRINQASDDAAGYAVATKMATKLSSIEQAENNVSTGNSMVSTMTGNYELLIEHIQRIRDLTVEAANGTYGSDSLKAIKAEVQSRLSEIDRVASSAEYNGISLMTDTNADPDDKNLQAGITSGNESIITIDGDLFKDARASALLKTANGGAALTEATVLGYYTMGTGGSYTSDNMQKMIKICDGMISDITDRQTKLGAIQNRLDSASDALDVQNTNLTSSLSTIRDADIAKVSTEYVSAQILQQASASLLTTANQTPSIALNLI